jgi:hypothetical protein
MSENNHNTSEVQETIDRLGLTKRAKIPRLLTASGVLVLCSGIFLGLGFLFAGNYGRMIIMYALASTLGSLSLLTTFGVVIWGVFKKGSNRWIWGALALSGLAAIAVHVAQPRYEQSVRRYARQGLCAHNMEILGKAMRLYANEHEERYPEPNQWCDLLIEGGYVEKRDLTCNGDRVGPCSYAMNPNCRSPADEPNMVLIFESEPGWNQSGGPELITCENHDGDGYMIFCNQDGATFEKCGNPETLNWGDVAE